LERTLKEKHLTTGIAALDERLGSLFIGDNVIWYDVAGSLAQPFAHQLATACRDQGHPLIYVSFDRSPKTLMADLGPLVDADNLTIVDCFTNGKGEGSTIFRQFYDEGTERRRCQLVKIGAPEKPQQVMDAVDKLHKALGGHVHLIFESLTGMQDLWGDEERVLHFYARACPRLFAMETIAYWLIEREAHSARLRARINQIAQVVMELSIKRGKSGLAIVKAQGRKPAGLNKVVTYWSEDNGVSFEKSPPLLGKLNLGGRLKHLRNAREMNQKRLARHVGVTPSTISQIEGNLIYPSLPALVKMAEILQVEVSTFFGEAHRPAPAVVHPGEGERIKLPHLPQESLKAWCLLPAQGSHRTELFRLEMPRGQSCEDHFFRHKGEEIGHLISGAMEMTIERQTHRLQSGSVIHLTREVPSGWKNTGETTAVLLWVKL
jgi:transcriptional regulator with XRE-family HTH domain/KaiC/GvpD/RAD55 family RecA-like ATPase